MSEVEELLTYLIGIAQQTQGAELWRALFAELLEKKRRAAVHLERKPIPQFQDRLS